MPDPDVVDFDVTVPGLSADVDEELDTASQWRMRLIVGALVVLAVAGLVTRAVTSAPKHVSVPAPLPPLAATQMDERPDNHFAVQDPAQCPPAISCVSQVALPRGFLAAVRAKLPTLVIDEALQIVQTNPPSLYFRRLAGSSGETAVLVVVSRFNITRDVRPAEYVMRAPRETIAVSSLVTRDQFFVQVQCVGPPGWHPTMSDLRSLAGDPRLRALG